MKILRHVTLIGLTLLLSVLLIACGGTATPGTANTTKTNTDQDMMGGTPMATGTAMNDGNMMGGTPMATGTPMDDGTMMGGTPMATGTPMDDGTMMGGDPMATATPMDGGMMMGGITITPQTGGNMNAFIHTGKAAINGKQVNVLMTNKGFALYYYMPDTMLKSTCTGQCAQDWPPLLAPQGMMTISSSMTLPKQLSVHQTPNGAQVFYDGHALYTYADDKQPNHATGRGEDMQWYLVGFLL